MEIAQKEEVWIFRTWADRLAQKLTRYGRRSDGASRVHVHHTAAGLRRRIKAFFKDTAVRKKHEN
jgi:hypothetical protein